MKQKNFSLKTQNFSELCKGFLYLSPWKSISTNGCYTTITSPIFDGFKIKGNFQSKLRFIFNKAKKHGILNPIVVGAIPFDINQESSLFIPESYNTFDRTNLLTNISTNNLKILPKNYSNILCIPNYDTFINIINKALLLIKQGLIHKVVLSRLLDIIIDQPIQVYDLMQNIIKQNLNHYQFYLPIPQGGILLGASPELIMRKKGNHFFSCPLAGSIKRNVKNFLNDYHLKMSLINSVKNRNEHDIVIQNMRYDLLPRSSLLIIPKTPSIMSTSTLFHLSTIIHGRTLDFNENALSLACLLHPTPALNGYPQNNAYKIIKELEPFNRKLFGGIIGWCDSNGDGEWVVTIRCGIIKNKTMRLFAGVGIVEHSNPEIEWQETNLKLKSMLNALGI